MFLLVFLKTIKNIKRFIQNSNTINKIYPANDILICVLFLNQQLSLIKVMFDNQLKPKKTRLNNNTICTLSNT